MGDVTLRDFLEIHKLLPDQISNTDLYLGIVSEDSAPYAQELASLLRNENVRVAVHLGDKKIGDQIKIADKKRIAYFAAIGADEVNGKHIKIKNLVTGDELTLPESQVAAFLISARGK